MGFSGLSTVSTEHLHDGEITINLIIFESVYLASRATAQESVVPFFGVTGLSQVP